MLTVSRLPVLRAVAREGSFSAAAESLDYTQSAVSQQIAALEREAGTSLVDRSARPVRMTQAGEALLRHAGAIFERVAAAEEELAALTGLRGGRLRIGSFPTAGATIMPQAIARFRQAYPDVELTLVEAEPEEILPQLETGALDLALLVEFGGSAGGRREETLRRVALLEDPMFCVLPADHPLGARESVRLRDLRDERWIQTSARSDAMRHVASACNAAGFDPEVYFETDDYALIQGLVAAGVGVALVPSLALVAAQPDVAVRPIAGKGPVRRVLAATARGVPPTPATEPMLEILSETCADFAPGQVAERAGHKRPDGGTRDPGGARSRRSAPARR